MTASPSWPACRLSHTRTIVLRSLIPHVRAAAFWQPLSGETTVAAAALCHALVIVSGTWSTTGVNALLAGLIGVAPTLLGHTARRTRAAYYRQNAALTKNGQTTP